MCCRYLFYDGENKEIEDLIARAKEAFSYELFSSLALQEVCPGSSALSFLFDIRYQKLRAVPLLWGYQSARLVINARSETCFDRPFFQNSHPCILPASGYYEWSGQPKQRYYFHRNETIHLCGLCQRQSDGLHFVILTKPAEELQSQFHDRQPVILSRKDAELWCRTKNRSILERSVSPLDVLPA